MPQRITGKLRCGGLCTVSPVHGTVNPALCLVDLTFCTLRSPSVETKSLSMGYFRRQGVKKQVTINGEV